jgi:hypothetical protein
MLSKPNFINKFVELSNRRPGASAGWDMKHTQLGLIMVNPAGQHKPEELQRSPHVKFWFVPIFFDLHIINVNTVISCIEKSAKSWSDLAVGYGWSMVYRIFI